MGRELDLKPLLGGDEPRSARAVKLPGGGWAALLVWGASSYMRAGNMASAADAQRAALEEARRLAPEHATVLDELIERSAPVE